MLDPSGLDESVEELLAAAETEADRAREQELRFKGSEREPLLRVVGLLGGVIVAAYASDNPAQALSGDELRQKLFDAAAIGEQERSRDPGNRPTGPPSTRNCTRLSSSCIAGTVVISALRIRRTSWG